MTAPAGVAMATRTGTMTGQSLLTGKGAVVARGGVGAAILGSKSADSSTGTFRSGLQSLLASMATGPANLETPDAGAGSTPAAQYPLTAGTEGKAGSLGPISDSRNALSFIDETAQVGDPLAAATAPSNTDTQIGTRSTQASPKTDEQKAQAAVSGQEGSGQVKADPSPHDSETTWKRKEAKHSAESTELPAAAASAVAVVPPMAAYSVNPPSPQTSNAAASTINTVGEDVLGLVETPRFDTAAGPGRSSAANTSANKGGPASDGNASVTSVAANQDAIKTPPQAANLGQSGTMVENPSNRIDKPIVDAKDSVTSAAANPAASKTLPADATASPTRGQAESTSDKVQRPSVDVMSAAASPDAIKTSPQVANSGMVSTVAQDASNQTDRPIVDAMYGKADAAANPAAIKTPPLDAAAGQAKVAAGDTSANIERPAIHADDGVLDPSENQLSPENESVLPGAFDSGPGALGDRATAKENAPALGRVSTGINEYRNAAARIEVPTEKQGGDASLPVSKTVSTETANNQAGSSGTRTAVPELNYELAGKSALKDGPNSSLFISPSSNQVIRPATGSVVAASLSRTKGPGTTKIDSQGEGPGEPVQTLSTSESSESLFETTPGYTSPQTEETTPLRTGGGARSRSTAAVTATAGKTSRATAQPSLAAKPASGSGEHDASEPATQSAVDPVRTLSHTNHTSEAVQGTVAQHGPNVAQTTVSTTNPAGLHGQISLAEKPAGVSPPISASASREPFAAIDAGFVQARATWIHAGANQAEAGYQDAALGWVGVRAEVSGGSIHAALVPGSADAAQALSGHMAGLNAYLTDHHAGVEKLTLAAAPQEQSTDSGPGQGSSQSMQQGTGQNSGQGPGPDQHWMNRTEAPTGSLAASAEARTAETTLDVNAYAVRTDGVHISVLA